MKAMLGEGAEFPHAVEESISLDHLSDLEKVVSTGAFSFFFGVLTKNERALDVGCRAAELLFPFIKENGEVDVLFLHKTGSYRKDTCRVLLFILMTLYSKLTGSKQAENFLPTLDPFLGGLFQAIDVEKRLLCRLLEKIGTQMSSLAKLERGPFVSMDMIKKETAGFCFTSSQGKKVGIGSISYQGEILIPSMGPHVLPLGKSDLYGLEQPLCKNVEESASSVKMWNRVKAKDGYGDHHIHSHLLCAESQVELRTFLWSAQKEEEVAFVLFVRGSAAILEGKKYKSGGLERVFEKSDQIEIESGLKTLVLQTGTPTAVEIIPLAGQEFFWNSDFIISFPYQEKELLALEISIKHQ